MNDTKWQEVFRAIVRHKIAFQIAWVHFKDWPSQSLQRLHSEQLIERTGLRDPGIGGPCFYRDILWLRFPYTRQFNNGRDHVGTVTHELGPFLSELRSLGALPTKEGTNYVELLGYATPVA